MSKHKTVIFSIFGEIERFVALAMIAEGSANRIDAQDIPATARYNRNPITGEMEMAKFAIVIPGQLVESFERRIANLRA
jgi:hypothetical protein